MITSMEPTHFESLFPPDTRLREIEEILGYAKAGNSAQVIGLPGGGKSHVMGLLPYNKALRQKHLGQNEKWFHFVLLDFAQVRHKPLAETIKFIFLGILNSLEERGMQQDHQKAYALFKESLGLNDELVSFQALSKVIHLLAIEKELTIVLLCDRFEEYADMATPELFVDLRVLRNLAKYRFSAVFSLNRPLEDILDQNVLADFYDFLIGNVVYVSLFDRPGFIFRTSYIEKVNGKTIGKSVLEKILELTGGHGRLTRLAQESLLSNQNEKDIKTFLLNQLSIQAALSELWQYLTPSEQHKLVNSEKRKGNSLENNSLLERVGLIKNGKIQIPLFETFIAQQFSAKGRSAFGGNNQPFVLDEAANEITKGSTTFSEKLTASEFKLLRFLLQNQGKVIEREEIITAIWANAKSTAGVTDQAIDQLIFRLRKKIEDDPNNPTQIITIKGRGIRFNQ